MRSVLIEYGDTTVRSDWYLNEEQATGYARMYYVYDGAVQYQSSEHQQLLIPGHLYILPTSRPYKAWHLENRHFCCVYMHVMLPSLRVKEIIELPVGKIESPCLYHFLQAVRTAMWERRVEFLDRMSETIVEFFKDHENYSQVSEVVAKVSQYIMEHMHERITVEQLSVLTHYHPNYFISHFKEETQYTPYQYIKRMRMQYAARQLWSDPNINELAVSVGYDNPSAFTRAFKQIYHVSPREYAERRQIQP